MLHTENENRFLVFSLFGIMGEGTYCLVTTVRSMFLLSLLQSAALFEVVVTAFGFWKEERKQLTLQQYKM